VRSIAIAFALAACASDGAAGAGPAKQAATKENAVTPKPIEWSMSKRADGKALAIEVKVANTTAAPLWVADRLVTPGTGGKLARTDRLTVMNGDDGKTARFVVGAVSGDAPSTTLYGATFTQVAPGASVKRSYTVPLPLATWNPAAGTDPLAKGTTQARLQIHTSSADPKGWASPATSDAEPLKIPEWGRGLTILQGDVVSLP